MEVTSLLCSLLLFAGAIALKRSKRLALRDKSRLWNNGGPGTILYKIQMESTYITMYYEDGRVNYYDTCGNFTPAQAEEITDSLSEFPFCGKFVEVPSEVNVSGPYMLVINRPTPAVSFIGKGAKGNILSLPPDRFHDSMFHEPMHVLGFAHEHKRHDRDRYVDVRIHPDSHLAYNYEIESTREYTDLGYPYDSASTTHYKENFAIKPKHGQKLGGDVMSVLDILKVNKLYNCEDTCKCEAVSTTEVIALPSKTIYRDACVKLCLANLAYGQNMETLQDLVGNGTVSVYVRNILMGGQENPRLIVRVESGGSGGNGKERNITVVLGNSK